MKRLSLVTLSSLVVLGSLSYACSDKKAFKGAAAQTTAPKAADEEPEPVAEPPFESAEEPETDNVFKDCEKSSNSPFSADLYQLENGAKKLPDYSQLTSLKKICLKQIDITTREFDEGFPGVNDLKEWFSLNFNFKVNVEKAGEYTFIINSDDGSKLFIDGQLVIDHDGQHSPQEKDGKVTLTAGSHIFNLQYFQGPANKIALELFWKAPGASEREYIPANLVSRIN